MNKLAIHAKNSRTARCSAISITRALVVSFFAFVAAPLITAPANEASAQQLFERVANPTGIARQDREEQLLLDADTLVFDTDRDVVTVKGNVQIFFGSNSLEADKVVYDRKNGTIRAIGKVRIIEASGNVIRTEDVKLSEDFKEGFIRSLQIDGLDETYFAAAEGERRDGTRTTLRKAVYSVCAVCRTRPGRIPTWRIKAEEIVIDDVTHKISYKEASFELLGIPIAYLPRFSHPDPRVKQKSGILSPRFTLDSQLGGGVSVPYYFAVGKDRDLTITPTLLTKQGALVDLEWRQRFARGAYTLKTSGIRQASPEEFRNEPGDRRLRGGFRTSGTFALNSRWTAGWDVLALSDRTFAEDYDRLTSRVDRFTSNAFVTGLGKTKYVDIRGLYFNILDPDTAVSGNLQQQQAVVHPVIDYDGIVEKTIAGGQLSYTTNFTSLSRLDEDIDIINGTTFLDGASGTQARASAELEWKRKFIAPGGHVITTSLVGRGDVLTYDQIDNGIAGLENSNNVARANVTGGLEWRYPILVTGGVGAHVFEPVAQIFASPNEGQIDSFLNEDAQTVILDDTNIFKRDRFAGNDRTEGGVRANVGLTHRGQWTDWLSTEFLVGQSFHLAGRNSFARRGVASVNLENGLQNDRSDIVGRFGITALDQYGVVFRGRASHNLDEVNRGDVTAFYKSDLFKVAFGYTFIREQVSDAVERTSQAHASLRVKAHEYWSFFGDARYDFNDNRFVNNRIGVVFDDRQVSASLSFFQEFNEDGSRDNEGFEFRVNFRTLGGF